MPLARVVPLIIARAGPFSFLKALATPLNSDPGETSIIKLSPNF
jgi:hypothetical protein